MRMRRAEALAVPLERHLRTVVPPNGKLLGRFVTGEGIANVFLGNNEFAFYFRPSMYQSRALTKTTGAQ